MRAVVLAVLLCGLVVGAAEARLQPVASSGTWKVADDSGHKVQLTWNDPSAVQLDFGRERYGVAYREKGGYVGVVPSVAGRISIFRITSIGDGDVQVAWRDDWTSSEEHLEQWTADRGNTTIFDDLPMMGAVSSLPAVGDVVPVDRAPQLIEDVEPKLPQIAQEAGVEGTVVLQVLVGRSGAIRDVSVTKSIPMLDAAAIACVRRWAYEPAQYQGRRVASWTEARVKFKLQK